MAKKPSFIKLSVWGKYSAAEREVLVDATEAEYLDWLKDQSAPAPAAPAAEQQKEHEPPKDVATWAKSIAAKIDDTFRADMLSGIALKKQAVHKVLDYVGHIERLKLNLPRWDSVKPADSNAPDTDFDIYLEPRTSKKNKVLDPVRRHRINDAFDASFPKLFNAVKTLQDMGADEIKSMGENTYDEKLADAKFDLNTGRNYFSDAAEVWSIWKSVNGVPGVRVAPHTKGDGSIEHKPFPWRLQDVILNTDGSVKDVRDGCNISTRDLQGYRPEVVNDMMQQKDEKGAPKWSSTYQALLNSQKPRKARKTAGATSDKGAAKAAQTSVSDINDWESASVDQALLTELPGFRAEFIKRCNDSDQSVADEFLLANYKINRFLDQVFSMADNTLLKRAGALADAEIAKQQGEKKVA